MTFLPAWAVDGSRVPASMARRATYALSSGASGVTAPGDLKVLALDVAGSSVRVMPGGALIAQGYAQAVGQTWAVANDAADGDAIVAVPSTGSGAGATRYVIVRIDDPEFGGQVPAEPLTATYSRPVVVSSLAGITYPFIPLAQINQPASTAAITQAMIVDLRKVALPLREVHPRNYELTTGQSSAITATSAYPGGATWPSYVEVDGSWSAIEIPEWATRARIVMTWNGVLVPSGSATGYVWTQIGANSNPDRVVTQGRRWDNAREGFRATGYVTIPASMRGTVQTFYPRATRLSGSNATAPVLDATSGLDLLVEFLQVAN